MAVPLAPYWELTKPRVVALIVFTALVGMFLAVPGLPPLRASVAGMLGIWLAAASAAAINHLIDQRIDKVMARTANRPLATGTLPHSQPGRSAPASPATGTATLERLGSARRSRSAGSTAAMNVETRMPSARNGTACTHTDTAMVAQVLAA